MTFVVVTAAAMERLFCRCANSRTAAPGVILASWCGKKVGPDRIWQRPVRNENPAVRNDRIDEIRSSLILQPGPAALTDGPDAIVKAQWPR